jgi:hypothetical protein
MSGLVDAPRSDGRVALLEAQPWAACDSCADLIDADCFGDLLDRSIHHGPQLHMRLLPTGVARAATAAMRAVKAEIYAAIASQHGPRQQIRGDCTHGVAIVEPTNCEPLSPKTAMTMRAGTSLPRCCSRLARFATTMTLAATL